MSEDQSLHEDTINPNPDGAEAASADTTAPEPIEAEIVTADEQNLLEEPDTVTELTEQLAAALTRAEEYRDQSLRTLAEMENLRRRTDKEIQDTRKFAVEKFAKELLVVLDSLELGIQAAAGDAPEVVKLREGSELTLKQFLAALEKFNVLPVQALGAKFDPNLHQAMTMEETDAVEPNTIVKVFQQGYTINERLLRPAMVVIAKKKA